MAANFIFTWQLIYNRSKGWGASDPTWRNEVIYYNTAIYPLSFILNKIVIHHLDNSFSIWENESWQQFTSNFAALGYHFFIDDQANIYEGRPIEIMGSHAGMAMHAKTGVLNDPDWGAIGIVLQGDYHHADDGFFTFSDKVAEDQLRQLENLILVLRKNYNIDQLLMHREVCRGGEPIDCPGDHLVPYIEALREKLGMKGIISQCQ